MSLSPQTDVSADKMLRDARVALRWAAPRHSKVDMNGSNGPVATDELMLLMQNALVLIRPQWPPSRHLTISLRDV